MKELTKQDLIDMNIRITKIGYNQFKIEHYSKKVYKSKEETWHEITPVLNGKYHSKSDKTKYYYIVGWSHNGYPHSYPLQRVIYAWFNGCSHRLMDIDHINNDPLDNDPSNLQELDRKSNLSKRTGYKNQYQALRDRGIENE